MCLAYLRQCVLRVAKAPFSAPWLVGGGAVNCIGVSGGAEIGDLGAWREEVWDEFLGEAWEK